MKKKYSMPQINNVELSIEEMVLSCCKISSSATAMGCTNAGCVTGPSSMTQGNNTLS